MTTEVQSWLTTVLFTLTYLALAVGKVPGLRVDRAGIALVGVPLTLLTLALGIAWLQYVPY